MPAYWHIRNFSLSYTTIISLLGIAQDLEGVHDEYVTYNAILNNLLVANSQYASLLMICI